MNTSTDIKSRLLRCQNCPAYPRNSNVCGRVAGIILQAPDAIESGDDLRTDGEIACARLKMRLVSPATLALAREACAEELRPHA
jgi:hypothetical protein